MREARDPVASSTGARTSALPTSVDALLAWAETQESKHEDVDGIVVMRAGASRDHEQVAKRVFVRLFRQVDGGAFDVNKGEFGVRLKEGRGEGGVLPPDVLVDLRDACGKERAVTTAFDAGWRKRVGVEPTKNRLAALPGFEVRTPHRGTFLLRGG